MPETTTHAIEVPGAVLVYDVHEPDQPSDHRPLFIFGSPMGAAGFTELVGHFGDRTVITYDPRVGERSTLEKGVALVPRGARRRRPPGRRGVRVGSGRRVRV